MYRDPEARREYARRYYARNGDRIRKYAAAWQRENRAKVRLGQRKRYRRDPLKDRDRNLQKWYGITLADFNKLVAEQKNLCKICDEPMPSPQVDHCHSTGKIRGLLCGPCNRLLGIAKDSARILNRAATYLTELK